MRGSQRMVLEVCLREETQFVDKVAVLLRHGYQVSFKRVDHTHNDHEVVIEHQVDGGTVWVASAHGGGSLLGTLREALLNFADARW